ncbi:Transmembrane secretion effector [Pedococcus dokdonensis]|uniref:Transmembrane secretion effector n=1 Tax=Pedococcus dokdonensis TaxID=443156 RepID=A0A1H0TAV7_9MICO|nr:MFS transporter [Pedococcus dokdonensis]SDP51172.1 Transmembrane secretion effector [Pedococcus dokdonensis]
MGERGSVVGEAGVPPARLRDDRDFRRYWVARMASLFGSLVTAVAMPVLVYRLTGSTTLTALTTTLEALPYLLFGLFSGAVGDRLDRKRVMVAADFANVVVIGSVPVAWWWGGLTVPHVLVAGFVAQSLFTFFDGANFGALPVLVGRDRVGDANAAVWGVGGILDLTVPAVVGLALAVVHPADLLAVDALTFLVSAMLVRTIGRALSVPREHAEGARSSVGADIREGVGFLWRHHGVRSNSIIGALQSIAGAGFMALAVPWCDRVLRVGTSGWRFGLVFSAWGIGGILAASLTPRLLRRFTAARLTLAWMPVSAGFGVLVALSTSWVAAVLFMIGWGVAYQLVIINSLNYRQQVTPERLLSRVNTAGRMLSWGLGWTIGALAAGALADQVGVRPAMLTIVAVGLVAASYAWLSPLPRIARVDAAARADPA